MSNECVHLFMGKFCTKLAVRCLEKRWFGGVDRCRIRESEQVNVRIGQRQVYWAALRPNQKGTND